MKCNYEIEGGRFKPVTFSFTCETLDEVKMLWHVLNANFSTSYNKEDGRVIQNITMAAGSSYMCWDLIDDYLSENGYE